MSDGNRSFWASVPGLITGLAGLLTGLVGLVSLSIQQGWIGGGSGKGSTPSTTTSVFGGTTAGTGLGNATADFAVAPPTISLRSVGTKDATVMVTNTGAVPLTISAPVMSGTNAGQFQAVDLSCTSRRLERNQTCQLRVSFIGSLQSATAVLVVRAAEVSQPIQVTVTGSLA